MVLFCKNMDFQRAATEIFARLVQLSLGTWDREDNLLTPTHIP